MLHNPLSHSENGWDLNKEFSEFKGVNIALNVTAGFLEILYFTEFFSPSSRFQLRWISRHF